MSSPSQTVEEFLAGGVKGASFKSVKVGHSYTGVVCAEPRVAQQRDFDTNELLTWDDGNPRMQLVVEVQTDLVDPEDEADDGVRAFYMKGQMANALKRALRKAGVKGVEQGGTLTVTWVGTAEPKNRKVEGAKQYEVEYVPPPTKKAQAVSEFLDAELPEGDPEADPPPTKPAPRKAAPRKAAAADVQDVDAIAAAKRQALIDAGFDPDEL